MEEVIILRSRRRATPWLALPILSLLILSLGWSALWLFARREAAGVMDAWLASEAAHARVWSCPERSITGFPLRIEISCRQPTFRGRAGGETIDGTAASLRATAALYQPNAIDVTAAGPLTLHGKDGGTQATLSWHGLMIGLRLLPGNRVRAALEIDAPALVGPEPWAGHADRFEFRLGPATGRPADEHAYDVWLTLADGTVPSLNAVTGADDPLTIDEKGILTRFDPSSLDRWQDAAETWRQAGGVYDVSSLTFAQANLRIDAKGQLGLDDAHRLAGRLQATMSGYEDLAARLGLSLRAVTMGSVLANLLSPKGNAPAAAASDRPSITLPIAFGDGHLMIGPLRTALRLDPLY